MDARTDRLLGWSALALSLLLLVLLAATIGRLAGRRALESLGWIAPSAATYPVGDVIDVPADVYRATPITVVLFARSNCAACEAAAPLYHSLAAMIAGRSNARMVLSSPVSTAAMGAEVDYARTVGLDANAVVPWDARKPRVRNVPTLVVVDRSGRVLASWEGAPRAADQPHVLTAIRALIGRIE